MIFNFLKKKTKNPSGNLFFKSNHLAYEYVQKFFSNHKLEAKGLYYGIYVMENFVRTHCLDNNNNTVFTFVCVNKSKDLKKDIKIGDFVLIGIEEVKKLFTTETLEKVPKGKNSIETALNLSRAMVLEAPRGVILKKATLELDLKSNQFIFDE
jgi:hypothetical protein